MLTEFCGSDTDWFKEYLLQAYDFEAMYLVTQTLGLVDDKVQCLDMYILLRAH